MAKKNWIYIKRGLSEDPKHRAQMGECIWLYMHIIDRADWEKGIAYDWKDEQEAADMSMPVRTLREQRRKLDDLGYISCVQLRHSQNIVIRKWINPRDYSGKVMNDMSELLEGDAVMEPTENKGDTEGYTKGDTKGSSQDVTPTSYSKSKSYSDPLWDLQHGKTPVLSEEDKQAIETSAQVEEIVTKLEEGLRLNFPRGTKDQSVYRRLLNTGKQIERFIEWVKADERRLSFAFLYAKDTSSIWRDFPQAFAGAAAETEHNGAFYG